MWRPLSGERAEERKDRTIRKADLRSLGNRARALTARRMVGLTVGGAQKTTLPPAPRSGRLSPSARGASSWLSLVTAYLALARASPAAALL